MWQMKFNLSQALNILKDFILNSITGVAVVSSILAGALASFYTKDILSNYLPFWMAGELSWKASLFWALVYFAAILFVLNQIILSRKGEASINKLDAMIKRLQTLPAEGYLPSYQSCYRVAAANSFLVLLSPNTKVEQLELAIRTVLGSILETARDFDKAGETEYSANVMLWCPSGSNIESISPHELIPNMLNHPDLDGVLELIPALSTTTSNIDEKYNPDQNVKSILLPIPVNKKSIHDANMTLRSPLLPGAPISFVFKVFASYKNIRTLFDWLDNDCATSLETINKIKAYFTASGDGEYIRSFGSIPILLPSQNAYSSDALPLGVLNIHSAKENLLQDNGQTLFAPLLEPFLMLLSMLILRRTELRNNTLTKQ